jgi:L-ribulose-5-phosphate 3-epimerase
MNNKLGVMQGRLVKKYMGRYQAHPLGYWEQEFYIAQDIGIDCIEFILDFNNADINPLLTTNGLNKISSITNKTNVDVLTVCADYFMEAPLHSNDVNVSINSQKILSKLVLNADRIGITDIVLPCVDQSSLKSEKLINVFVEKLNPIVELAENKNINISLETDLAPKEFAALLNRFKSDRITVNYDVGNSASLGYDLVDELDAYGSQITDIHIKDRKLGDGSIELGKGDADFPLFFQKLKEFDYHGPFIMQAYRDDEGLSIFNKQLHWIKSIINE